MDQFRVPNVSCLAAEFPLRSRWDRLIRKTGLRAGLATKGKILKNCGAQLLHSHFGNYGWGDMEIAARARVPQVVTFYGVDVNKMPTQDPRWKARYQDLFGGASRFLCEGPHMAKCLVKLGCPSAKITVHHLGVRVARIAYRPRRKAANRPFRILMCASFVEKKGLPYALEALAQLGESIPCEATLIGGSTGLSVHAGEANRIEETIRTHKLAGKIRRTGFLPYERMIEESYEHDIFLSPSVTGSDGDTEGGAPVTIAVMAATGMPIVSTTHCDIPEIVQHGVSARLVPERDAAALSDQLRWFHDNPDSWEPFGAAARRRMEEEFDCLTQGAKLGGIYRETVGSANG